MKKNVLPFLALILCISSFAQEETREYYQLKTYTFDTEEQVAATDYYLEHAFLPALKRLNITNVGVFKPRVVDSLNPNATYVLIPFKSLTTFESLNGLLSKDEVHNTAGAAYLKAPHDRAPYTRISSTLLKAFEKMPLMEASKLTGPREDRIYELRSYEAATEALYKSKVDMFNAGGEVALFDKLGFNAVFYAEVISGAQMPNLMYMTTHANQETRDANWKAFGSAPEWSKLKVLPQYQNTVSRNDTRLLYPTDYSDY